MQNTDQDRVQIIDEDYKFRLLDRLLQQISRVLQVNRLDKVTREVVEAARDNLVIGAA